MFRAIDPTDGRLLSERAPDAPEVVIDRARAAAEAQSRFRHRSFAERVSALRRLAAAFRSRRNDLADLVTREMGKPLTQAGAEVDKCALAADFYADEGPGFLAPRTVPGFDAGPVSAQVVPVPLGVVLAIMPWNFPLWQVVRAAVPALMAGNGVVLKHAPNVPGCADALEAVFREAGFPDGSFLQVRADLPTTGALIEDDAVAAVTLTGSTRAGVAVAERAGRALKKCVLELGGSDPYVMLPDADIGQAASTFVASRMLNNGQSCIAAKRLIVLAHQVPAVEEAVVAALRNLRRGDPRAPDTDLGPLAREDLRDALHRQVQASVDGGARLLLGGTVPDEPGWWYPPTLLSGVGPGTPAYDDELFGPVAAIVPARDVDDAIRIANDSAYGLGAAVLTSDPERGEAIARDALDAGIVAVNDFVRSDPRLPFGGVKRSGHGRELGREGVLEFVNVKTVMVRTSG